MTTTYELQLESRLDEVNKILEFTQYGLPTELVRHLYWRKQFIREQLEALAKGDDR